MRGSIQLLSASPDETAKAYLDALGARCVRIGEAQVTFSQRQMKVVGFRPAGFWRLTQTLPMSAIVEIEPGLDRFVVRYLLLSPPPWLYAAITGLLGGALLLGDGKGMLGVLLGAGFAGLSYIVHQWHYRAMLLGLLRHAARELRLQEA